MRESPPTTVPGPESRTEGPDTGELAVHWIFPEVEGRITPLPPGTITLGRDAENDVVLTGEQTSRRHAQIERRGAALSVRDLGSRNGVFVNGTRLPESPLCVGDLLRVGGWLGVIRMVAVWAEWWRMREWECDRGIAALLLHRRARPRHS
jgi:pSer/pThr/pTyr-binding forkhead associated (FHA) protein